LQLHRFDQQRPEYATHSLATTVLWTLTAVPRPFADSTTVRRHQRATSAPSDHATAETRTGTASAYCRSAPHRTTSTSSHAVSLPNSARALAHHLATALEHAPFAHELAFPFHQTLPRFGRKRALHLVTLPCTQLRQFLSVSFAQLAQ
jgi:hypothetical protein